MTQNGLLPISNYFLNEKSMPIEVACKCGKRFAARDEMAGRTVACPGCKAPLTIIRPAPSEQGVASILDEVGLKAGHEGLVCPKCRATIPHGTVVCPKCRYNVQTASYQAKAEAAPAAHGGGYDWKSLRKQPSSTGSVIDDELTLGDIMLCGLCSGIAFIYGIILLATGRSKGILMILGSCLVPLLFLSIWMIFKIFTTVPPPSKKATLNRPSVPTIDRHYVQL